MREAEQILTSAKQAEDAAERLLTVAHAQLVTVPRLARFMQCRPRTIMNMIKARELQADKVGRCWRIPLDEVYRVFPATMRNVSRETVSRALLSR